MVGVIRLGASGLYVIEREQNENLTSFGDALWWAISTTTTVGYGDTYPQTGEGRLIAVLLMLTGIGVISVFTATIASLFMIEDEEDEFNGLHKRLDEVETKLDRLLSERVGRVDPHHPIDSRQADTDSALDSRWPVGGGARGFSGATKRVTELGTEANGAASRQQDATDRGYRRTYVTSIDATRAVFSIATAGDQWDRGTIRPNRPHRVSPLVALILNTWHLEWTLAVFVDHLTAIGLTAA